MLDRRHFMQHSAAITAAMAALRSMPVRAEEPAPATKKYGANDKIRVAVVGVRGRGMSHVGGFNGVNGCEIVTVCDCDESVIGNAVTAITKKTGKPDYVKDIRKVLEDKSIDVVSFATPNHWHALGAIWAMQAGKQVYVEKPASHNVVEGRRMVQAARKHDAICQVGTQSRSNPGMRAAVAAIHAGKIGAVKTAYATCYKRRGSIGKVAEPTAVAKSVDYDLWSGPAPILPIQRKSMHYDWHWIWAYGNGDLGNQGVHEMDKARWGLQVKGMPKSVMSVGGRFGYVDDGETANTQLCVFDYGDSEMVFEVRGLASESPYPAGVGGGAKGSNFVGNIWYGDKGTVVCPGYNNGVLLDPDNKVVEKFSGGSDADHFANFVKAVRSHKKEELNCEIEEGHLSAALCHLANVSYRLGEEKTLGELKEIGSSKQANAALTRMVAHLKDNNVDLMKTKCHYGPSLMMDNATERFSGNNPKANELLGREYRKGFEITEKV
ncbi:Gfo/Idh/MocA family protein [Zavarzinella formosa]|uniref:Gfo/Idh/MocA family protein n=1 Tax=Zavarzinella formosa TaxID=360055 RepID=UPI0002E9DB8A|nr:Gfo/Idh/MocA family oxidoreductase [Zavarzinella formosa]